MLYISSEGGTSQHQHTFRKAPNSHPLSAAARQCHVILHRWPSEKLKTSSIFHHTLSFVSNAPVHCQDFSSQHYYSHSPQSKETQASLAKDIWDVLNRFGAPCPHQGYKCSGGESLLTELCSSRAWPILFRTKQQCNKNKYYCKPSGSSLSSNVKILLYLFSWSGHINWPEVPLDILQVVLLVLSKCITFVTIWSLKPFWSITSAQLSVHVLSSSCDHICFPAPLLAFHLEQIQDDNKLKYYELYG